MNILGISALYHDSAAALVVDGRIIAASEEERFTRKKFDSGFPTHAAKFCLEQAGLTVDDIDYVVFYEKPFEKFERILNNTLAFFPKTAKIFTEAIPVWLAEKLWFEHVFFKSMPALSKAAKKKGHEIKFLYSDHHLSHAASSYYCSGFKDSAILTVDGVGEWSTTTMGVARGAEMKIEKKLNYPHSLGLLYSTFTAFLGFAVNSDEYKVMGLAGFGKPTYMNQMEQIVDVKEDGSFHLNMEYFGFPYSKISFNKKFEELFGPARPMPKKGESEVCDERQKNIAATIQRFTEDILIKQAQYLYEQYKIPRLCMAGGVALNCVANGRILRETKFEELYVCPAAGDSGGAVGAALFAHNVLLNKNGDGTPKAFVPRILETPYLGSGFSDKEITEWALKNKSHFEQKNLRVDNHTPQDLVTKTADAIAANKVVGWFQGRQEFGPRALGHRSILANPACKEMQEILNVKIKHREVFRPFAPSVILEKADEYFDLRGKESPYMLLVADVKEPHDKKLPAITHIDGTARVQTVTKESEPRYYELIKAVGERTGYSVVVNTSFNVRGEPIVRTMDEAFHCFMTTDMDVLVVGDWVIEK